jgi:hypothetical protein
MLERTDRDQHDVPCFSRIACTFVTWHVLQNENKQRNSHPHRFFFILSVCTRPSGSLETCVFCASMLRFAWEMDASSPSQCIHALDFLDMQELKESSPGKTILACFFPRAARKKKKKRFPTACGQGTCDGWPGPVRSGSLRLREGALLPKCFHEASR